MPQKNYLNLLQVKVDIVIGTKGECIKQIHADKGYRPGSALAADLLPHLQFNFVYIVTLAF